MEAAPPKAARTSWRARVWVALVLYGVTALWSMRIVSNARAHDDFPQRDAASMLDQAQSLAAVFLGPCLGPFARHWQACGIGDSHEQALVLCALVLGLGLALQFVPLPESRGASRLRLFFWSMGWSVWFGAAVVSVLHWFG